MKDKPFEVWEKKHSFRPRSQRGKLTHMLLRLKLSVLCVLCALLSVTSVLNPPVATAQTPDWCKPLPRPEYKSLERIPVSDPWFEVYKVAPDTFAIYEPQQFEEVISYLILGHDKALLFDTGMGISDIRKLTAELTKVPIIVLNSHTHNDHVGGNWQFATIYSMDTDFTRQNAKGSSVDAQAELAPDAICGNLPQFFNARDYRTNPWHITRYLHGHLPTR